MLGLNRKIVEVVSYRPQWKLLFEDERKLLKKAVGEYAIEIEHIGSTSVFGLDAKPIIDIVVAVEKIEDAEKCVPPLENIGYEYRGEQGIAGRYYFSKGTPTLSTHHLNVVEINGDFWKSHILFRDYLRQHDDAAAEYGNLKRKLAAKYKNNRKEYTESKAEFIEKVLTAAGFFNHV